MALTAMPAEFELDWVELSAEQIKLKCREAGLPAASKWEAQAQYLTFLLEKVLCITHSLLLTLSWINILRSGN